MKTDTAAGLLRKTVYVSAVLLLLSLLFFFFEGEREGVGVVSGVMLSSIFICSSAWVLERFREADNRVFIKAFFLSMAIRFLVVLVLFGILVGVTKIDEIYFTVSFIISYLCQSVTEMIFLNQILQKSDFN